MKLIEDFLINSDEFQEIHQSLQSGNVLLSGVTQALQGQLISALKATYDKPLLIIVRNEHDGRKLYDSLIDTSAFNISPFLLDEFMTANVLSASSELRFERLQTLKSLTENPNQIIIANIGAIRRYLTPKEVLAEAELSLKIGSIYEPTDLAKKAVQLGYNRVSTVITVGEFSMRGGIIDIFPKESEHPLRIEFFDDEVDTIRLFDVETQRSIRRINNAEITLLYEFYYEESASTSFSQTARILLDKHLTGLADESRDILLSEVNKDIARVESYSELDLTHKYLSLVYDQPATLMEYLDDPLVVWVGADKIAIHAEATDDEVKVWYDTATARGEVLAGFSMQADFNFNLSSQQLFLSEQSRRLAAVKLAKNSNFDSKGVEEYHGNLELFTAECAKLVASGKTVAIVSDSGDLRNSIINRLTEADIPVQVVDENLEPSIVNVVHGDLEVGFELVCQGLVVFTDAEIRQGRRKKRSAYRGKVRDGARVKDHNELQLGDFVVHLQHGIARYVGVDTIDMLGVKRDVLVLEYKKGDRVYVPIDKIDLVQKYVGSEGAVPRLSRLGGRDWEQTKQAASKMVKDIAQELIRVYAQRKYLPGYAFSQDSVMQREFEDACEFVETADQLKTAAEIKADMEKAHPMDRLLIGDVGYGKTEVAMRAAMKAVVDHKQVVYVAPTTILVRQQFETFKQRFEDHAVEIRILNRHVSGRDLEIALREVASGKIDILIGTHRVLSKDVKFKDLGLLIVDEEQRFGVEHKEVIKQLKTDVDVLTLTATPIPRTMQMSMIGIRSMSMIETPPENRYPVQTYVLEAHDSVVRDAIERELARDGQVFYLHNRVSSLLSHVKKIQGLVPDARIGYAHGKMTREVLEDTMQDFEDRKFDVLVCTTIIETGIDIPNANTLIVGDAYRLGLAQMYQLRGRVGRSDRIAYAYFLYPRNYVLSENSEKRLQTIREFTALGSGFKIAMRDLAIRGAGDMLGTRQQGFLDTVGLDLYTKMLAEAIKVVEKSGVGFEGDEATTKIPIESRDELSSESPTKKSPIESRDELSSESQVVSRNEATRASPIESRDELSSESQVVSRKEATRASPIESRNKATRASSIESRNEATKKSTIESVFATVEDLTAEMLAESARELDIGIGIDRYIPDEYISDPSLKIEMYKKMKAMGSDEQYQELQEEFVDRFGEMPAGVANLVELMYLKNLISPIVEGSRVTKTTLEFTLTGEASAEMDVKLLYGQANKIGKSVQVLFKDAKFQIVFELSVAVPAAIKLFSGLNPGKV